jgi:hypothetical protein
MVQMERREGKPDGRATASCEARRESCQFDARCDEPHF